MEGFIKMVFFSWFLPDNNKSVDLLFCQYSPAFSFLYSNTVLNPNKEPGKIKKGMKYIFNLFVWPPAATCGLEKQYPKVFNMKYFGWTRSLNALPKQSPIKGGC